jgi:hypothetical protein
MVDIHRKFRIFQLYWRQTTVITLSRAGRVGSRSTSSRRNGGGMGTEAAFSKLLNKLQREKGKDIFKEVKHRKSQVQLINKSVQSSVEFQRFTIISMK